MAVCLALALTAAEAQDDYPAVRALTPRAETYPALSPDGRHLAYASGVGFALNLYLLDLSSGKVTQLTDSLTEDSAASWSPDGAALVFQREDERGNRDIWRIGADGRNERNLTNTPDIREQHPRYAPDGRSIVFDANREASSEAGGAENYELYQISLPTGQVARLTHWPRWDMYPSMSPDGDYVVWRRALSGPGAQQNFEIFVRRLESGEETNLTDHPAYDTNPHWSPAGDWIVFASNRTGAFELYLMRPDGSALRRITNAGAAGMGYARPSFSADGTRVVANRVIPQMTDMVVIEAFPDAAGERAN